MSQHQARYPQAKFDFESLRLTARQINRLASAADLDVAQIRGLTIRDLRAKVELGIEPSLLFGRKICGRVVKKDASGTSLPVPFAQVTIYDTDITGTFWSPADSLYSWFFPLKVQREKIATVVTDECGRFCVRIPFFDLDFILRWRLERQCYFEWLRRPTIRDVLRQVEVVPKPEPGPDPDPRALRLDDHLLRHAARVLDAGQVDNLRKMTANLAPGFANTTANGFLDAPRWSAKVPAPLPSEITRLVAEKNPAAIASITGLPEKLAAAFDPRRAIGPLLRCTWHLVPHWHLVLDIPDITFEVTQDVNGDGVQDLIYSEGYFDVRWNTGSLSDVELVAGPHAIASATCDSPIVGPCGDPAILFAGNYELQQAGNPSNGHNRVTGYALYPNVPRFQGNPSGARLEPGASPFRSNFYLWGCAERKGADRYRIRYTYHPIDGAPAVNGVLSGVSWTLIKLVGGVVNYLPIADFAGWYPIVARDEGWTPVGLLALVPAGLPTGRYEFTMEFGVAAGSNTSLLPGSATASSAILVDNTAPANPGITSVGWRVGSSGSFTPLPLGACPVVNRGGNLAIQFQVTFSTSAHHLRDVTIGASGCGPSAVPTLASRVTSDPYYELDASTIQHWHESTSDNASNGTVIYNLAADAPAGCYNFGFTAVSRAIDPNQPGNNTANNLWHSDPTVIYTHQLVTISVQ